MKTRTLIACLALSVIPPITSAHHSRALYDMSKEVTIEGTVTKLDWRNPHIFITVETTNPNGEAVLRDVEVMSTPEARALGLSREAISPGARVIVRAHPNRRNADARVIGLDVRAQDGTVYPLNTDANLSLSHDATKADGIAGKWVPTLASFRNAFAATRTWQYTEAGRARQAEAAARPPATNTAFMGICEQVPPPILSIFPDLRTIEIGEKEVLFHFQGGVGVEMIRSARLDLTSHPADVAPSMMGHSIAYWEGETLVVDTVAFTPHDLGLLRLRSGPGKHLTEKFTLAQDKLSLEYTYILEDPENIEGAATYTATWEHRPDLSPANETCDPATAQRALEE